MSHEMQYAADRMKKSETKTALVRRDSVMFLCASSHDQRILLFGISSANGRGMWSTEQFFCSKLIFPVSRARKIGFFNGLPTCSKTKAMIHCFYSNYYFVIWTELPNHACRLMLDFVAQSLHMRALQQKKKKSRFIIQMIERNVLRLEAMRAKLWFSARTHTNDTSSLSFIFSFPCPWCTMSSEHTNAHVKQILQI